MDEVQNNAEEVKITASDSLHEYYWSTDDKPFEPVWVRFEISNNSYPLVKDAPSADMKSPKYDWRNGTWEDNLADSINARMTKTTETVKTLSQTVSQMQANAQAQQKQATENDNKTNKSMQALQQVVMTMSQSVAQQSVILTNLANKLDAQQAPATQPTTPQAKTEPQVGSNTTDAKEEGAE